MATMKTLQPGSTDHPPPAATFQSTLWSQVRAAGRKDSPEAQRALHALCQLYWFPIYSFLRRYGQRHENAEDLTQGFFLYLLEGDLLQKAEPDRGRFRSFLLGTLKYFVSNEIAREQARKRGGGAQMIQVETVADAVEDVSHLPPDRVFDRHWALVVLGEAVRRLAAEYSRGGLARQFELLQPYLTGDADTQLTELARQLGKSPGATRILVFRLRNRFRALVRAIVADTVTDLDRVDVELRHLEGALRE
jgi:RNA polymerase sigma factor (sigma-70 family)